MNTNSEEICKKLEQESREFKLYGRVLKEFERNALKEEAWRKERKRMIDEVLNKISSEEKWIRELEDKIRNIDKQKGTRIYDYMGYECYEDRELSSYEKEKYVNEYKKKIEEHKKKIEEHEGSINDIKKRIFFL